VKAKAEHKSMKARTFSKQIELGNTNCFYAQRYNPKARRNQWSIIREKFIDRCKDKLEAGSHRLLIGSRAKLNQIKLKIIHQLLQWMTYNARSMHKKINKLASYHFPKPGCHIKLIL
jgi:hypothetical protein